MILKTLSYKEFPETNPRYWELEKFELGHVNLFVGSNSAGKSRTLNLINGLSRILQSPTFSFVEGTFDVTFQKDKDLISFYLDIQKGIVMSEYFELNGVRKYLRDENGNGKIFNNNLGISLDFNIPKNQILATRRDSIQFPYLEDLYNWSSNVRHFRFSMAQEKQTLALIDSNSTTDESKIQNLTNQAIYIYRKGISEFSEEYQERVKDDFNAIGYKVSNIEVGELQSLKIDSPVGDKLHGLRVQESDRQGFTDQNEMSDGMFRALSLIIHFNYYQMTNLDLTVLIDDIGEGLDFERSTKLIRLAIERSVSSNIQLIMSSNDKFVLNNTKLEYWQILVRNGGTVSLYNHLNSREKFEEFKFLGLNNFDFFTTESFKDS